MDVSVIIVNWNTREILLECLESLERCKIKCRTEVIVVDNGSEDGSGEAVRIKYPEVKLIENDANLGFAKANNIGMKQAIGRYLCLINSDVKVREGCIDSLVGYMDANPGIGMAGPRILHPDLSLQDSCRRFPSLRTHFILAIGLDKLFPKSRFIYGEHMRHFSHDKDRIVDYISGCFMLVRREAVDLIGLMDERFFIYQEEIDWCRRMWIGGWKVAFFAGAQAIHHHAASSKHDPVRFFVERQKAVLQYWQKYYGCSSNLCLAFILYFHHALRIVAKYLLSILRGKKGSEILLITAKNRACLDYIVRIISFRSVCKSPNV